MMKLTLLLPLSLLLTAPMMAQATISSGTSSVVANGGVAPGSASDFVFFGSNDIEFGLGAGGQPTALTHFTVSTLGNNQYPGNPNYTSLIAPGGSTPFTTGTVTEVPTNYPNTTPHTELLAVFSIDAAGSFTVYILDGNTDGVVVGNSSVGLGVNGGAETATATNFASGTNEFTAYTVTGASATDVFDVYATTSTNAYPTVGGLTFTLAPTTVAATPEPSGLVLLGTGTLGVLGAARRRFGKR